ncbi:MAG: hypothetical protein AD742_09135 [Methylibium sp. NZG]|nr:MAG: hypothetical protein AD742_09135 [Methylibium sp. NZG]
MTTLPPDHPHRLALADEAHARPPEPLSAPARATYVAVLVDAEYRGREQAHLAALCATFGVPPPAAGATHHLARLGDLRFKWERHGEFSGYTFFLTGDAAEPNSEPPSAGLPPGWLAGLPGHTVAAAQAALIPAGSVAPDAAFLAQHFSGNIVVGSEIGDGAGTAFTDFRVQPDGFTRFLLVDRSFTPRQAGRTLQRLFEIEVYRLLALLALPIARRLSPRIVAIEQSLGALTDAIAQNTATPIVRDDETLLHELTRLAAEVESGLAASQFRFGACRAYFELVTTRTSELREQRLQGLQTIEEFMARRFTPAVATCNTVSQRLHDLSERVAQASALLSTRVDITRERQNQALLASMDKRARLQLRLQQTVEGLSVAAITYYLAGVIGYLAKGLKAGGARIDPDLVVGAAIPLLALGLVLGLRRARRRITQADRATAAPQA